MSLLESQKNYQRAKLKNTPDALAFDRQVAGDIIADLQKRIEWKVIMSALTVSFSCHLAFVFRELIPVLDKHIKDNSGEILPHIIMSEYCRFSLRSGQSCEWLEKLFSYLETEYSEEDNEISELVAVSFIEILPYVKFETHWPIKLLGPKMRKQYDNIYGL